jgi:hypothetical protein
MPSIRESAGGVMEIPICSIAMAMDKDGRLLFNALKSFEALGYGREVEVIIADDGTLSEKDIASMADYQFRVKVVPPRHRNGCSGSRCIAFNAAFKEAEGKIIIIQDSKCMHLDNVVNRAIDLCGDGTYLAFGCYSIGAEGFLDSPEVGDGLGNAERHDFLYVAAEHERGSGWPDHSVYRPRAHPFCCAITAKNLRSLNGFDEKYSRGIGYENEEFLFRIREGKLRIIFVDDCVTLWQSGHEAEPVRKNGPLVDRNRLLYERYTKRGHGRGAYLEFLAFYCMERLFGHVDRLYDCYIDLLLRYQHAIAAASDLLSRLFRSLYQRFMEPLISRNMELDSIPIIINNRNRLSMLKKMLEWLIACGMKDIHILDNDSTYEPLLAYYSDIERQHLATIHRLRRNVGPYALWQTSLYKRLRWKYYIYTDSDVLPCSSDGEGAIRVFKELLVKYPWAEKVGFGIRIDDIPDNCPRKSLLLGIERQYWMEPVGDKAYAAPIDTTFALYRPLHSGGDGLRAIRTGDPYVVRHLPWYIDPQKKSEEELFYEKNANCYSSYIQLK